MSSFILFVVFIVSSFFPAKTPADLRATLDPVRDKFHAPAIAGAIIRDGRIVASGVCGVRALNESQQPATLADRWPVGSCTKPMTRFMIGRLMERGELSTDATLGTLLPAIDMRPEYKAVTLSDVLAHRAGIQPYTQIGPRLTPFIFKLKGSPIEQRATFAAHVLNEDPAAPPGTEFVYSNAGYCVAAVAAETRAGKPWNTLVQDEVLTPLGMTASLATADADPDQPRGHIHEGEDYRLQPREMPRLAVMEPAGGVRATAEDFARFAGAYADIAAGRAVGGISASTARKIAESRPGDEGSPDKPTTFFGGDGAYTAAFAIWPHKRLAVAVTSNAGDSDALCAAAIEAIRAAQAPDAPPQSSGGPSTPNGPRYGFAMQLDGESCTVTKVEPGSIADKAGLREGDGILSINGKELKTLPHEELQSITKPKKLILVVEREGKEVKIEMAK